MFYNSRHVEANVEIVYTALYSRVNTSAVKLVLTAKKTKNKKQIMRLCVVLKARAVRS